MQGIPIPSTSLLLAYVNGLITANAGDILISDGTIYNPTPLNAGIVPVTPSGNLASTNIQSALVELQNDIDLISGDHGDLTGLSDDDHLQYLNELRHDSLPQDNPHGVTKAQVGLGNVDNTSDINKPISSLQQDALDLKYDASNPNAYETPSELDTRDTANRDRSNHTGTQLANTISDLVTAVQAAETVTSLSLNANILTFTDEDGNNTNIDLSLYLDDTNLSRILSGVLNPTTGIATFTRDDNSTFTVDFSLLQDGAAISAHEAAPDPHPQYETSAEAQAKVDAHANLTNNPHNVTKAQVGLGNVDNTSDINKPISTAAQTALDLKYDASNPAGYINAEAAQDAIAAALTDTETVQWTYDDPANQITAVANPIFGQGAEDFINTTPVSFSNSALVNLRSFTTTSKSTGRYRVMAQLAYTPHSTSRNVEFELRINGTLIGTMFEDEGNDDNSDIRKKVTLLGYFDHTGPATFNIEIWGARQSFGTATLHNVIAETWRIS